MASSRQGSKCRSAALLAILFILIGAAGIGVSTYYWHDEIYTEEHGRFGIVFDAGGSGTRMYIYEYKNDRHFVQTYYEKCEGEGLTKYSGESQSALKPLLDKCLQDAVTNIPNQVVKSKVPLFMKATAGMRKLRLQNETEYNSTWGHVRDILANGTFPVKIADTMSGSDEAQYSWTTINLLLGDQKSRGLMEMGSTSLQIAFEPSKPIPSSSQEHAQEVQINGRPYNIYAHSYLCMGRTEFGRRYYAKLARDKYNDSHVLTNPCGFQGYSVNKTSIELWENPCVKGDFAKKTFGESLQLNNTESFYTFVGTGNFAECKAQVESMFFTNCSHANCGTLGVYQPEAHGHYMGIGGGAFFAADFLKLPEDFTEDDFEGKTKDLCSTNLTQVSLMDGFSEYSLDYCLSNTYTNFILQNVLKINKTEKGIVAFVSKINGEKISWTLGSMNADRNEMSPALMSVTRELETNEYRIIIVLSSVLILFGFIVLLIWYCCKNGACVNKLVV